MQLRYPKSIAAPKTLIKVTICVLCLGGLYFPTLKKLVSDLITLPDFNHGFLFPPISLYLFWKRSGELEDAPPSPSNSGLAIILFGLLLFLLGNLGAENFITRVSFLVVLTGITLFLLGRTYLKAFLFPIGLLIFAIPLPSILMQKVTFPMQLFASQVATWSLHVLNIPVLREGNIIHLLGETLEVAEACSGIRSLLSLIAVGTVLAYFTTKVTWHRIVMVLSCFPIAIIVNAFRVSATGILANHYGIKVAQGFFHGFSGAVLYFSGLIMVAGVGLLVNKVSLRREQ